MRTISQVAEMFGVSRATLLYYDAAGLFSASERSASGYRQYTDEDVGRLEEIRQLRELGVPVARIRKYLSNRERGATPLLLQRIIAINEEIVTLRNQQKGILSLIEAEGILKSAWGRRERRAAVAREAGITEGNYRQVHRSFENASPQSHRRLLRHLGFSAPEIVALLREIRKKS